MASLGLDELIKIGLSWNYYKHPKACLWRRGMACLLWVQLITSIMFVTHVPYVISSFIWSRYYETLSVSQNTFLLHHIYWWWSRLTPCIHKPMYFLMLVSTLLLHLANQGRSRRTFWLCVGTAKAYSKLLMCKLVCKKICLILQSTTEGQ